jgi:hypothetical protein
MARQQPIRPSEEGDAKGLELARAEGEAQGRTLRHMTDEIADDGGEERAGEYLVAYAVEKAEGMYAMQGGRLVWQAPGTENVHVEIAVRDPADGRFIPGLRVEVTLIGTDGTEIGPHELPLLWHPYLYHYGRNFTVPASGNYRLRLRFPAPDFMRHDEKNGRRFLADCDHTFADVKITAARE